MDRGDGPRRAVMVLLMALLMAVAPPRSRKRVRPAARPDAGVLAVTVSAEPDAGDLGALRPCAALPALPPQVALGGPQEDRLSLDPADPPPWDGGTCQLSGRVRLVPAAGARPPAGLVVFLEGVPPSHVPRPAPVRHPVRQLNRQFFPRLSVIQRRDTMDFFNDDQERHQVFSSDRTEAFDIPSTTKSLSGSHRFRTVGSVRLQCNIHPSMRADVLVLDNPLWTLAAVDGSWQLEVPEGTWRVVAWEPNGGRVERRVEVCREGPMALTLQQGEEPVVRKKGGPPAPEYSP